MSGFYKIDLTKISFAEAWRINGWRLVILIAYWRLLGVKRFGTMLVPSSSGIVRVNPSEVDDSWRTAILPIVEELQRAGFEVEFWYQVEAQGPTDGIAVAALNELGCTLSMVPYAKSGNRAHVGLALVSTLGNGKYLSTSNIRMSFTAPPEVEVVRLPEQPPADVIRTHKERVRQADVRTIKPIDVEPLILELQRINREENVRRGLYVPA